MDPTLFIKNSVVVAEAVDEPIANKLVIVSPLLAWIENFANDEVEPTDNEPVVGSVEVAFVVVAGIVP